MADPQKGRSSPLRFYAAVGVGVGLLILLIFATRTCDSGPPITPTTVPPDSGPIKWCGAGLEPVEGGACFAAPRGKDRFPLIIYLHGLHTPATIGEEQERQARVARRATEKGFGVVAFHGEKGKCSNPDLVDTYCWPSNERTAERAPNVVDAWKPILDALKNRGATSQKFLFGFSNGGYFTFLIATRKLLAIDAAAIAHAGAVGQASLANWLGIIPPILLETADDDASNGEMIALDAHLTREKWPHAIAAREGGHTVLDWNVDTAITFFTRVTSEAWPLNPPLAVRAPRAPRPAEEAGAATMDASLASDAAPSPSVAPQTDHDD